jgi:hypothetical protein
VIVTPPGEEAQVDYGTGPMVRHPVTGKYRRTRLFVLTLGYSRKSVRLLLFESSTRSWAELHEQAFRRLGGVVRVVVLDNLREGVLTPDIYEPGFRSRSVIWKRSIGEFMASDFLLRTSMLFDRLDSRRRNSASVMASWRP